MFHPPALGSVSLKDGHEESGIFQIQDIRYHWYSSLASVQFLRSKFLLKKVLHNVPNLICILDLISYLYQARVREFLRPLAAP
jgi:hypothetical protein